MPTISTSKTLILDLPSGANAVSSAVNTKNQKCQKVTLIADSSFTGVVFFVGSDDDIGFDASLPADDTNDYSPICVIDYNSGNSIPGDAGIDFSAAPFAGGGNFMFEIQSNGLSSFALKKTGPTGGTLKAYMKLYDSKD